MPDVGLENLLVFPFKSVAVAVRWGTYERRSFIEGEDTHAICYCLPLVDRTLILFVGENLDHAIGASGACQSPCLQIKVEEYGSSRFNIPPEIVVDTVLSDGVGHCFRVVRRDSESTVVSNDVVWTDGIVVSALGNPNTGVIPQCFCALDIGTDQIARDRVEGSSRS